MKGKAVDIWALGVTLYSFVHGYCPFEDTDVINLCRKIEEDPVIYSPTISPELKDLLSKMLQKDPDKRITLPEIKKHCWVTEYNKNPMMSTEENCIYEEITDEEIANAVQPAFMFVSKVKKKLFVTNPLYIYIFVNFNMNYILNTIFLLYIKIL